MKIVLCCLLLMATNIVEVAKVGERVQCHAATASGVRCRRKAAPECLYCRQHVAAAKKASAQKPCGFIGDDGVRCPFAPQTNARYCPKHMPRDEKERTK